MKYLKYIGIALLVLALIFFGRGLLTPSVDYECALTVDKSVDEVWSVLEDESKTPEWIEGFKRIEPVSGVPGSVGAVSHIFVEDRGEEMMIEETITKVEVNEAYAMRFTMDFMNMDYEITLDEDNGKTTISTKTSTQGNGLFAKSMVSFMKGAMKKQEEENLQKLKAVIENNSMN
jgi:uncharacterized protein YndB with AHSA1/START domain